MCSGIGISVSKHVPLMSFARITIKSVLSLASDRDWRHFSIVCLLGEGAPVQVKDSILLIYVNIWLIGRKFTLQNWCLH